MAAKTYYFKDAVPTGATLHRSLQDGGSAPTTATTSTGWVAATNAIGQSCLQNGGTEVARGAATWGTTLQPSAAPSQTVGDCWRSENTISGTFANTDWVFNWLMRSVTSAYTGRFKLAVRIWRSTDANGASATEITSGRVVSAASAANMSTTADTSLTCTWTPGATVTLAGEYLFVNVGIEITSAGSINTQDMDFRVGSTATFVTPDFAATQALTPGLFSNAATTFHAATVAAGAVALTAALFTNSNNFYAATLAPGAVNLTASLVTNSATFYSPTVDQPAAGAQDLTPGLFSNTATTFYAPTVSAGAVGLTPALFTNSGSFYAPTVTPVAVALTPSLLTNSEAFYAPTVTPGAVDLTATRLDNSSSFYAAAVSLDGAAQDLTAGLFSQSATFYAPTVAPGAVGLTVSLFTQTQTFYAPTVTGGDSASSDAGAWVIRVRRRGRR